MKQLVLCKVNWCTILHHEYAWLSAKLRCITGSGPSGLISADKPMQVATVAMPSTTTELPKATNSTPSQSVSNGVASGEETGPGPNTHLPQSLIKRSSPSSASWQLCMWSDRTGILEVVILSCIIAVAWGLCLVPTIMYALPPLQVSYILCLYL